MSEKSFLITSFNLVMQELYSINILQRYDNEDTRWPGHTEVIRLLEADQVSSAEHH